MARAGRGFPVHVRYVKTKGVNNSSQSVDGTITPAGSIVQQIQKIFAGSITPTSTITKSSTTTFSGAITPAGAIIKSSTMTLAGSIVPGGDIIKLISMSLAGEIDPSGVVSIINALLLTLEGSLSPSGALLRRPNMNLVSSITPAGNVGFFAKLIFGGSIAPSSQIIKLISKRNLRGTITPSGIAFIVGGGTRIGRTVILTLVETLGVTLTMPTISIELSIT